MDYLPKSEWGPGPWQTEPDRVEFDHFGYPCLMVRNTNVTGSWCGYVAVPPGHRCFGLENDEVDKLLDVHGGVTYTAHCEGHICHVPKPGEPDNVWWIGFDCSHAMDLMPRLRAFTGMMSRIGGLPEFPDPPFPEHYWTVEDTQKEVRKLAKQLNDLEVPGHF